MRVDVGERPIGIILSRVAVLLLVSLGILAPCSAEPCEILAPRNDREASGLCGPVFEVREPQVNVVGSAPVVEEQTRVTLYDRAGNEIVVFGLVEGPVGADNPRPEVEHTYGKGGLVTSTTFRTTSKAPHEHLHFAYDDERIQGVEVRRAGEVIRRTTFLYDGKSRLTAAVTEVSDGSLPRERRISYDNDGRIVERMVCDSIGCFDREVFSYDSAGRLVERTVAYPGGGRLKTREVYQYDSAGHRLRTQFWEAHDEARGVRGMVKTRVDGRAAELTEIGLDGEVLRRWIQREDVDSSGNWIRSVGFLCPPGVKDPEACHEEGLAELRNISYYQPRKK